MVLLVTEQRSGTISGADGAERITILICSLNLANNIILLKTVERVFQEKFHLLTANTQGLPVSFLMGLGNFVWVSKS